MMTGTGWAMGVGGAIWMLVAIVLIAALAWAVIATGDRRQPPSENATEILKARFARGEITEAEYEQARRLLGI